MTNINNQDFVIDKTSKLMWEIKIDNKVYSLFDALDYAYQLNAENYCGYNDWRIPNKSELETLISNNILNLSEDMYWSSTPCEDNEGNAYLLSVYHKMISSYTKRYAYYIRCVRDCNN